MGYNVQRHSLIRAGGAPSDPGGRPIASSQGAPGILAHLRAHGKVALMKGKRKMGPAPKKGREEREKRQRTTGKGKRESERHTDEEHERE